MTIEGKVQKVGKEGIVGNVRKVGKVKNSCKRRKSRKR